MSELFEEDKDRPADDEAIEAKVEPEVMVSEHRQRPSSDARKRLETLLEEKRLRDELEDFGDY